MADELFIEIDLAQRAAFLASAPSQDAFAVEKVSDVAGQRDRLFPWLEVFHAKCTLIASLEENFIVGALVETEDTKLSLLI